MEGVDKNQIDVVLVHVAPAHMHVLTTHRNVLTLGLKHCRPAVCTR